MANEFIARNGIIALNNSQITGSLTVSNGITGSLQGTATTASYVNTLNQDLTFNGNLTLNGTASLAYLNVSYETASVIYSSGSNQFGDASDDTQTLYGNVIIPIGSLNVNGGITGSLLGTATTASYVLNAISSSFATTASRAVSSSFATTASYVQNAQTASYLSNLESELNNVLIFNLFIS